MAENKLSLTNIISKMLTRKNPDDALAGAKEGGLEKTLGVWDLIILGVGAIIGSGIFAVVGTAAAAEAGETGRVTAGAFPVWRCTAGALAH